MYTHSWVDQFDAWLRDPKFFQSNAPIHLIKGSKIPETVDPGIISPLGKEFMTTVLHHALTMNQKLRDGSDLEFDQVEDYDQYLEMVNLQAKAFKNVPQWIQKGEHLRFTLNPRIKGFIGWQGNHPITTVTLVKHGDIGTIWDLAVHPEMRGVGLGSQTIKFALDQMRKWDDDDWPIRDVLLNSSQDQENFYQNNGFQSVGTLNNQIVTSSLH
jgi:GNAT superfamily N-acetyltransferase